MHGEEANAAKKPSGRFVCVFGVSGVGKTSLIQEFIRRKPSWRSVSASTLLVQSTGQGPETLRRAPRPSIEQNQYVVAELIREKRAASGDADWLLDAHSIINRGEELVQVPAGIVSCLEPTDLVFIFDQAGAILGRRVTDARKLRPTLSIDAIRTEQDLAYETCLGYGRALSLPVRRVAAGDIDGLVAAVTAS